MKRKTMTSDVPAEIFAGQEVYEDKITNNIENFIGLAKVPIGLAGPLVIHGEHAQGEFHVPLATTEGTLVASASRGMKLLTASGGVRVCLVADRGIQRAPVFEFDSIVAARQFAQDIVNDTAWFTERVEATTRVGRLQSLTPFTIGRFVHLRVSLLSGDAAGQNMVSVAVANACAGIADRYPAIVRYFMDGGLSGEKMPSHMNTLMGRGKQVTCSAAIPDTLLYETTRARSEDIVAWHSIFASSAASIGWQGTSTPSTSNTLAALFIATGQDVGSVPESSLSFTTVRHDIERGVLEWEMTISGLVVGTYGGGTHLPSQRAALEMMDCYGTGKVYKLCELAAATIMAAEISLIAAVCAGDWVTAHARMGRNRH
ncbi:hydroxymethylglutaryl-CoA reductase [Enhygromyxa salina]|uniref:Hydroxymethylglutaryl-coenzyme A reductase n=1 Tax=Enhygromyxa salina TaxID=215803 RepID=A0A2S9Y881_9BACT|nr:hydroxymethylglutaryl-CoA reductase [Enhygromyxa salina]PRQ01262.1 Hydroxymethylglutaryl-coenzyme A reductase [Enhygromyxa salina]